MLLLVRLLGRGSLQGRLSEGALFNVNKKIRFGHTSSLAYLADPPVVLRADRRTARTARPLLPLQ